MAEPLTENEVAALLCHSALRWAHGFVNANDLGLHHDVEAALGGVRELLNVYPTPDMEAVSELIAQLTINCRHLRLSNDPVRRAQFVNLCVEISRAPRGPAEGLMSRPLVMLALSAGALYYSRMALCKGSHPGLHGRVTTAIQRFERVGAATPFADFTAATKAIAELTKCAEPDPDENAYTNLCAAVAHALP